MQRYLKPTILIILLLIFAAWFAYSVKGDMALIFQKDLLAHDESVDSVTAANVTRQFFPPMVRVNPLNDQQGIWTEGPVASHVPPMFAYAPYLFFKLDGQVTIEMKRLSFAFVLLLTGLLFILIVYLFSKNLFATFAAFIASIFWINTPFTRELITGYAFGVSDIVLAFTVVCAFGGVLWYLDDEKEQRLQYPFWKLALIAVLVALPIMAKNLLGAIPAATFFVLILRDSRKFNAKFWEVFAVFFGVLAIYFVPLYLASPIAFANQLDLTFSHFKNLEGWGRPWYYYIANYLPQRYLFGWTWWYYAGMILSLVLSIKYKVLGTDRKTKILLGLSLTWFVWNLVAISLVQSKVPNFIYQSYLLSLFGIMLSLVSIPHLMRDPLQLLIPIGFNYRSGSQLSLGWLKRLLFLVLVICFLITGREVLQLAQAFKAQRAQPYSYQSEHEKFYQTGEQLRQMGVGTKDLTIVRLSDDDCWFRYYVLFLTGAESKTLLEVYFNLPSEEIIAQKYKRIFYISPQGIEQINYSKLQSIIVNHTQDIQQDIQRIKKDKQSCQWLVPDRILNAP